ncbi:hypothetical protein ACFYO2_44595 [Streptomyces sp. NPDC006602]|uniref:hypothetical protein n=1 Tax=Streptomyces sp. NPDC006602 TaxID=3364751 RepID=UPI003674CD3F
MRYRGVVYDVGLKYTDEGFSVEPFDPALVDHDMRVIATELHANAVRIEGENVGRLLTAGRAAHAAGLAVYFSPWKMNAGIDETRAYLAKAAAAAEQLRSEGADIVFVTSCEYTSFGDGIFPGASWAERSTWLGVQTAGAHMPGASLPDALLEKSAKLNKVLRSFAETIRATFGGPLTYSAGTEAIDWSIFDIVGVDYYRRGETEEEYVAGLSAYRHGKPLAVMEVGCCTYEGAAVRGDGGFMILQGVNPDGSGIFEGGVVPTRSEREQADYAGRQLELLADADVHAVFVFTFSFPAMRTGEGAKDLDMTSFALVKTFGHEDPKSKAMPPWEPKESFHRVAEFFRSHAAATASDG